MHYRLPPRPQAQSSLRFDMLCEASGEVPRGGTVDKLHDLPDQRPIVRHLEHDHVLVGVGPKVRLAGGREVQQDLARHLVDEHVLALGEADPDVPHHLEPGHHEALVLLVGLGRAVPWRGHAGRADDLSAVCCAGGYDPFGGVGVEACYVAVGCFDECVADWRHFGGETVELV